MNRTSRTQQLGGLRRSGLQYWDYSVLPLCSASRYGKSLHDVCWDG